MKFIKEKIISSNIRKSISLISIVFLTLIAIILPVVNQAQLNYKLSAIENRKVLEDLLEKKASYYIKSGKFTWSTGGEKIQPEWKLKSLSSTIDFSEESVKEWKLIDLLRNINNNPISSKISKLQFDFLFGIDNKNQHRIVPAADGVLAISYKYDTSFTSFGNVTFRSLVFKQNLVPNDVNLEKLKHISFSKPSRFGKADDINQDFIKENVLIKYKNASMNLWNEEQN